MQNILKWISVSVVLFLLMGGATTALAQSPGTVGPKETSGSLITKGLKTTATESGFESVPLPALIGRGIQALLGVVGIIFLVLIVYGGFLYMTDAGAGDKVKKAKQLIGTSLIGLVIIIAAYALTEFVITTLVDATKESPPA